MQENLNAKNQREASQSVVTTNNLIDKNEQSKAGPANDLQLEDFSADDVQPV